MNGSGGTRGGADYFQWDSVKVLCSYLLLLVIMSVSTLNVCFFLNKNV